MLAYAFYIAPNIIPLGVLNPTLMRIRAAAAQLFELSGIEYHGLEIVNRRNFELLARENIIRVTTTTKRRWV